MAAQLDLAGTIIPRTGDGKGRKPSCIEPVTEPHGREVGGWSVVRKIREIGEAPTLKSPRRDLFYETLAGSVGWGGPPQSP